MSFLEINNLDIEYKTRKETIYASKNVSFNLQRGEIIGIVGESGSGKSTVANAIITESTLSFLGVGVPPTTPSLGTLIRFGNNFLFSGEWWITFFPAIFLVILALSINLLGDWMRDALNPKLKAR